MAHGIKGNISVILNVCIESFSENVYIFDYNARNLAALESTNVLHEEYDENLSLGMPMHPIEEDIDNEDEQEKEEWHPPPYSNSETENSIVIDEHVNEIYYYSDESDDDTSMDNFVSPNNDFDDNEECVFGCSI